MSSEAQLTANRENAQFSTGPSSVTGKSISSRNPTVHGFYIPLAPDDPEYLGILGDYTFAFDPEGAAEAHAVIMMATSFKAICQINRAEPILLRKHAAAHSVSLDEAFVDLFSQPRNNTLKLMYQRRDQAQKTWLRFFRELQRLQKLRGKQAKPRIPEPGDEIGFVPCDSPETPSATLPSCPTPSGESRNPMLK